MQKILKIAVSFFMSTSILLLGESNAQLPLQRSVAGEVVGVLPLCNAQENCLVDGTVINLKFQLMNRCSDLLLSYTANSAQNDIEIVAFEELDPDENCLEVLPEPQYASITVQDMYPPMVIHFAGTGISIPLLSETVVQEMQLFAPEKKWWPAQGSSGMPHF